MIVWPGSGSLEPVPSSVVNVETSLVWFGPASAVGAWLITWIVTVSLFVPPKPSSTVSWNWRSSGSTGAVNVGWTVWSLFSVTVVPPIWVHVNVSGWFG